MSQATHSPHSDAVLHAALAGLLHDVGKFMLRAARKGQRTWDADAKRDFKYKHAMLSATFVRDCVPSQWRATQSALVGNHHVPRPDQPAELAVALADHLSAAERDSGQTPDGRPGGEASPKLKDGGEASPKLKDEDEVSRTAQVVYPQQLRSILAQVTADGPPPDKAATDRAYWPLAPLTLTADTLFPGAAAHGKAVWDRYDALYQPFEEAARSLRAAHEGQGDLTAYVESLLLLMQRYTWAVPAAYYKAVPDISLYDHSRTAAALAALLAAQGHDAATLQRWHAKPEAAPDVALLVGADLSGVQDFLYTISNRGATSALRGRSFYLQLLTEAVARYVLRRLGLPITNLLYAGGGNFYLLAAPKHAADLPAIQTDISRVLLHHHRGALYVALAATPLQGADFVGKRLGSAWKRLTEALGAAKQRRFADLPAPELAALFAPHEDGGNEELECQVCGMEHPQTQVDRDGATRKCPACRSYEALGKDLRNADFLLLREVAAGKPVGEHPGGVADVLAALGLAATVTDSLHDLPAAQQGRGTLLALNDAALADLHPGPRLAVGRRFLANATPLLTPAEIDALRADPTYKPDEDERLEAGGIKPFSVLAHQADGIKRLGVLRMDVDNLGKLFAEGLGEQATLSRVAALSFAVSLYFEGWVEQIAREEAFRNHVYCIYSGGDDLFFVGSWDKVVEFARRVRGDFAAYAAYHPGLHASAGIALAPAKYPLAQAAADAGEAEHAAKAYQVGAAKKDAVCFLDEPLSWARFGLAQDGAAAPAITDATTAHGLMALLVDLVEKEDAPRSLIRQLVDLALDYRVALAERRKAGDDRTRSGEVQELWGPWMWRGVYQLERMARRAQDGGRAQTQMRALRDHLRQGTAPHHRKLDMAWIGLAARWAELKIR
jgi:CRISPR-associated protein Csm1